MNTQFREMLARLDRDVTFLPDKPEESADSTLRALWHAAAGQPLSATLASSTALPELDEKGKQALIRLFTRRLAGEPLAHIIERQHFMGMEMLAGPAALVPRVETELLAQAAIELAEQLAIGQSTLRVIDVCTGAGNVALAIARHVLAAQVWAADISASAIDLAKRNAKFMELGKRVQFCAGDLLAPFNEPEFMGTVDVLTCNPPYISSAKVDRLTAETQVHEPRLAFDGGPFGVNILMRLLHEAPPVLRAGGWLAFEVGLGQGDLLKKRMLTSRMFTEVRSFADRSGAVRVLAGQK